METTKANTIIPPSTGNQNFVDNGNFFINGNIDDSIAKNIIAPLVNEINIRSKAKIAAPINFYVTSHGGYVKDAFDIISWFDYAKKLGVPVHTHVTSVAFSAGSLIAVSGHKRFASVRAYHGLHFARGSNYAHNSEMADRNTENFKWQQSQLIKIYRDKTKLKNIEKLLIADNYMINGGDDLLKFGLIDEII
jgi:ATP-dependent protease ClpP protease subunit